MMSFKKLKEVFSPPRELSEIIKDTPLQKIWDERILNIEEERKEIEWSVADEEQKEEVWEEVFSIYKKVSVPATDFILLLQELHTHVQNWKVNKIVRETVISLDSIAYLMQFSKQKGTPAAVQQYVLKSSIFLEDATQPWITQLQNMIRTKNEGVEDASVFLDIHTSTSNDFVLLIPAIYTTNECMVVEEEEIHYKDINKKEYMTYQLSHMNVEEFVKNFTQSIQKVSKKDRLKYMKETYERSVQFAEYLKKNFKQDEKEEDTIPEKEVTLDEILSDFEAYSPYVNFKNVQPYEPSTPLGRLIEDVIDKEQLDEWVKEKREKSDK